MSNMWYCNTLPPGIIPDGHKVIKNVRVSNMRYGNTLQCTAMHCNALKYTVIHYNTLPHAVTHFDTL